MPRDHLHATNSQNADDRTFSSGVHAQVPYQGHGKESNRQIRDGRAHTVQICDADEDVVADTLARRALLRSIPKEVDGAALEHCEEEEDDANGSGKDHGGI